MSEEIKIGKYLCKDGRVFEVRGIEGDAVTVVDGDDMIFTRKEFSALVKIQAAVFEGDTERTYTASDIERIVAIASREQRYKCADVINSRCFYGTRLPSGFTAVIQNAPAPSVADVLAEFEKTQTPTETHNEH